MFRKWSNFDGYDHNGFKMSYNSIFEKIKIHLENYFQMTS